MSGSAGRSGPVRAVSFIRHADRLTVDGSGQRRLFVRACARRGWGIAGEFAQDGESLRQWDRVLTEMRAGRFGVVVVSSLAVIAETVTDQARVLAALRDAGVRLLVVRPGIDTGDAEGAVWVDALVAAVAR